MKIELQALAEGLRGGCGGKEGIHRVGVCGKGNLAKIPAGACLVCGHCDFYF